MSYSEVNKMPYIQKNDRERARHSPTSAGELNFAFTELIRIYIKNKGLNYQHVNDILGALTGAKDEFYRRIVIPYENAKISLNGDVYD